MATTLRGGFTTPWEYDRAFDRYGRTYFLWKCQHREGYTAYQVTLQANGPNNKPTGTAHYVGIAGVNRSLGINLVPDEPEQPPLVLKTRRQDGQNQARHGGQSQR